MQIVAQVRQVFGKKNKKIRKQNILPAVLMQKGKGSEPLCVRATEFEKVFREVGETSLLDLSVEGKLHKVLISEVQFHPVSSIPVHVAFREVDLKERITAQIPVEVINEEENEFVKSKQAIILRLLDQISVKALPTDLPRSFVIDATRFEKIGDELKISDLVFDKSKIEIVGHEEGDLVAKLDKIEEDILSEESELTEEEVIARLEATEELSEEERARRAANKKSAT